MAKMHLNCPPWLEEIFEFIYLKWLKMHLNCLEKNFQFMYLKSLKMHLNCPPVHYDFNENILTSF